MNNILFSWILAFVITFFAIPPIIQLAKNKKLFDEPDERKVHKNVIPTLGGLGIFAGFIITTLISVPINMANQLQYFMAAFMIIFFIGIKDDIVDLSAYKKFIAQLIAAGIIVKFGGLHITNMDGFLGIYQIPQASNIVFTVFTIIVITNSFNLIDGVDGLAGSLGLLTALIFGLYFYITGHIMFTVMALSMAGSLCAFLIYNFSPAKIFMGDTGSLLIGILNSIFVIKFMEVASDAQSVFPLQAVPAIGFSILIIPLFDTLRVFAIRIFNGRSPFSADQNHIHHRLLHIGFSHKKITFLCVTVNIIFICLAYFLQSMGTTITIAALVTSAALFVAVIYYTSRKEKFIHNVNHPKEEIINPRTFLSLVNDPFETTQ